MQNKSAQRESKSLKTFFLYSALVFFVILGSLAIKAFFVIQQSKFDGKSQFIIAITKDGTVEEVLNLQPTTSTISVLKLKGKALKLDVLGKTLGVIPNAFVTTHGDLPQNNPSDTLLAIAMRYSILKTNLTLFDVGRLLFLAKKTSPNEITTETIALPVNDVQGESTIKELFTDQGIVSDNLSIEIINASDQPGMGGRLEQVITNMGGNVVSVSTSHSKIAQSQIQYFGQSSYTLEKFHTLLRFPVKQLNKETLADIVITIGENSKRDNSF